MSNIVRSMIIDNDSKVEGEATFGGSAYPDEIKTTLVSRNITVFDRRTSIRLEPEMWKSLKDIAERENCTIHDVCTLISIRKREKTSLTAAIRVFLMLYYKAAATEDGHRLAGHGNFQNMLSRARVCEQTSSFFKRGQDRAKKISVNDAAEADKSRFAGDYITSLRQNDALVGGGAAA